MISQEDQLLLKEAERKRSLFVYAMALTGTMNALLVFFFAPFWAVCSCAAVLVSETILFWFACEDVRRMRAVIIEKQRRAARERRREWERRTPDGEIHPL